jgi:hypothetical protein
MPVALEAAGSSRIITAETAAYIASRLAAKWATQGDITSSKDRVQLTVDFIPAKTTMVPFRYEKQASVDSLDSHFHDAFEQFLRYLVARPMTKDESPSIDSTALKEVATALDREYGWFVTAEPGKSDKVVAGLARSDGRLARLLFNPSLYPGIGTPAVPQEGKPAASTTGDNSKSPPPSPDRQTAPPSTSSSRGDADPSVPKTPAASAEISGNRAPVKPREPETPPQAASPAPMSNFVPPPPRSFSQKLDSAGPFARRRLELDNRLTAPSSFAADPSAAGTRPPRMERIRFIRSEKTTPAAMNKASPPAKGFKIQIVALRDKEEAEAIVVRMVKTGFAAEIESADLKERGVWYRVRLTGYGSHEAAEAAGKRLLVSGQIHQFWVVPSK